MDGLYRSAQVELNAYLLLGGGDQQGLLKLLAAGFRFCKIDIAAQLDRQPAIVSAHPIGSIKSQGPLERRGIEHFFKLVRDDAPRRAEPHIKAIRHSYLFAAARSNHSSRAALSASSVQRVIASEGRQPRRPSFVLYCLWIGTHTKLTRSMSPCASGVLFGFVPLATAAALVQLF